jgi:hypothetical protein
MTSVVVAEIAGGGRRSYVCLCILSKSPACSEATMPGSSLSSSLPLPFFPLCLPLFPPLVISSRPPLPLPTIPLSPSSPLFTSLRATPPHLSPLIFISVRSPRLLFPSTIWMLIPPFQISSSHVFFVEVLFSCGWWEFFPRPLFFVIRGLSLLSITHFLPASSVLFFLCTAFPSTIFQPSVSGRVVVVVSVGGAS